MSRYNYIQIKQKYIMFSRTLKLTLIIKSKIQQNRTCAIKINILLDLYNVNIALNIIQKLQD